MSDAEILSPAVAALLDIMTSTEVAEGRCIEAARAIIEYEAPPGVFDLTHRYLMGMAQDAEQDVGLRLEALKLLRKVEARRVVPSPAPSIAMAKATTQAMVNARKRMALNAKGQWPTQSVWAERGDAEASEDDGLAATVKRVRESAAKQRRAN